MKSITPEDAPERREAPDRLFVGGQLGAGTPRSLRIGRRFGANDCSGISYLNRDIPTGQEARPGAMVLALPREKRSPFARSRLVNPGA